MFDTNYTRIAAPELKQWMDEGRAFTLLDVLPAEVFAARHLPGAKNACVFEVDFPEHLATAGVTDKSIAMVAYGEDNETRDATEAASKLVRMGYAKVYLLAGGFQDWKRQEMPLEGTGNEPADHKALPTDGSYAVATEDSGIVWTGRKAGGRHTGTLAVSSGTLRIVDGKVGGEFTVPLSSLTNTDLEDAGYRSMLLRHLLSDDFFFAERFPEAVFKIEQAEFIDGATPGAVNYHVRGELFLRGRAEILAFPLTVQPTEGGIVAEAHFDMDRTRWGALYGSGKFFRHLGMHLVNDMVSIQVHITAR